MSWQLQTYNEQNIRMWTYELNKSEVEVPTPLQSIDVTQDTMSEKEIS